MGKSPSSLKGETHSGREVSFSKEAYSEAMRLYRLTDIEEVVIRTEKGKKVAPEVARFFRDFAIVQAVDHPDHDRSKGIGSLATRIELAAGEITPEELNERGVDHEADCYDYELAFKS